jgi:peptidoglycan biosynthesis protein MviN/MurJ (putative lipid II flippase)
MHRHLKRLETRRMSVLLGKVLVASAGLALVCFASQHWLLAGWEHMAFMARLGLLMLTIGASIAVFLACGAALRIEELQDLMLAVNRRMHRR